MLDRQVQQADRVIRQKVLPNAAQRQVPAARCDPARPAHPREALRPPQMLFEAALSSQPLAKYIKRRSPNPPSNTARLLTLTIASRVRHSTTLLRYSTDDQC